MKKHIFRNLAALMLAMAVSLPSSAENVSVENARQTALDFLAPGQMAPSRNLRSQESLSDAITLTSDGNAAIYVFNRKDGGYVVVSADDSSVRQILGWSDSGSYDPNDTSSPLKDVLETYAVGIGRMRLASEQERNLVARNAMSAKNSLPVNVDPLLGDIEWGQDTPYNRMVPTYTSPYYDEPVHYPTGCVATALAQVMMYHRWPEQGRGSNSYTWFGRTMSADFSKSTYRWDLMLPSYSKAENYSDELADAVALLMHDIGIALKMWYDETGSSSALNGYELYDFFDYDRNVKIAISNYCTTEEWEGVLRSELADGRPVLVSGGSQRGGHEYVCDGYDADGYFHYNFGWDGTNNGWFASTATGYDASPSLLYGVQKNCGGTGALSLHSEEDFMWVEDNTLMGSLSLTCAGLHWDDDIDLELALALENTATGEVTYYSQYTTNYSSNAWTKVVLDETVPDGTYKAYPVGRIVGQEWQTFFHNSLRQLVVDLTVSGGVKTWANNNLLDPIEDGAVEVGGYYYLLDDETGEATMTRRNSKGNSYKGDVVVPDAVTYNGRTYPVVSIGARAFEDCEDLKSVKVGVNVLELAFGCFGSCHSLESVTFAEGSNLKTVGGWAFNGCYGLKSIVLPEGTLVLSMAAFQSSGIESITIPSSVYYVVTSCFAGCDHLKDVYLSWTSLETVYWYDEFANDGLDPSTITIHVPAGCADMYRNYAFWPGCNIVEDGRTPDPQPVEAKFVYILGNDGNWDPSHASDSLALRSDGCYGGDFTVKNVSGGYGYFCMGTVLGMASNDWDTFNAHRLGAPEPDYLIVGKRKYDFVWGNDASFMIPAGTHHLVVNPETCTFELDCPDVIDAVRTEESGPMYDIYGRRILQPVPGQLLIRNGKKFIAE